jgi:tetratricopeptide (TPR) repeat protein
MEKDVTIASAQATDLYDLMAWLHANRQQVIKISAVVLAVGAITGGYFWHKNYKETAASEALSILPPPSSAMGAPVDSIAEAQPYLKLADDYSGTAAASRALLVAGGILFDAAKFDQAGAAFERFVREYSGSPLVTQAMVGLGSSLEAQGKTADAVARFDAILKQHPSDSVIPQAKSALARLYLAQNKPDLAMRLYEEMTRANINDTWTAEASIQLQELLAKYPNLKKPAPAPGPLLAPSVQEMPLSTPTNK